MKRFFRVLLYYAAIPLAACLPGFALSLCGLSEAVIVAVPASAAAIYVLLRKKLDMPLAAKVNGAAALLLLVCFTVLMLISSGNAEGSRVAAFCWLILPFAPVILTLMLTGQNMLLYSTALLTYGASFAVSARYGRIEWKKTLPPLLLAAVCAVTSAVLYANRPAVKYAGHGFAYMHGFSSTDLSDYMVTGDHPKLARPDAAVPLVIEKAEDMPVLDGAEACYPLYAAFAKAVYKDIDEIERQWLKEPDNPYRNGRIVTFTNSVVGFSRLLHGGRDPEKYGGGVDMFFGARPSVSQMREAEEFGVELEITPIGREAFVFFVEADNPVSGLTSGQLRAIYHGDITNWSELGGEPREIRAFQRPKNSGSQTMMEYFMGDVSLKEPKTYETVDAMAGVIREVAQYANENGALGYSFRYFLEELHQETGVKMLSVDGVYPSLENIENGTYPLVTDVCLITRRHSSNPYVRKMTEFILSEEGQEIVRKTGYAAAAR